LNRARFGLAFISPAIIFFVLFWSLPVLLAGFYSFTDWRIGSTADFIGLDNFTGLLNDPLFQRSVQASLWIAILVVSGSMLLGLGIALILADERIRFARMWRLIVIVPVVADWVATGLVFQLIFLPNQGVLAALGHSLGLDFLVRMRWTTSADLAPFAIAIFVIWKQTGLYAIFLLAGLRSIPTHVVEAAQVDGASPLQTLMRIKLPLMKPILAFVLIFAFLTTLGLFEPVFLLTAGGPAGATRTLPLFLFENFFTFGNSGYASAAGIYFLVMSLAFAFMAAWVLRSRAEDV
jgi:ABC-type sugar transport system permease subunit